jgi:hypothetical protein
MTPQEEQMLNDLIGRIGQTRLSEKDPDAEQLLNQGLGRNPDALYTLAQTVLVQKYALEQAQSQLQQLQQQQQTPQPARSTSFLGSLLGHRDQAPAPPPPPPPQPSYGAPPPPYGQPYGQQWGPPPGYGAPPPQGGGPSFLRSAATTAAGVAAGALAFEGVESLMHGFGGSPGLGGGSGLFGGPGGAGGGAPEETVINNYYDDPGRDREGSGDASNLQTAGDDLRDDNLDDDQNLDDTSYGDDSSSDDSQGGNDGFA